METFRFRLNCVDHYQAVPTELDPQLDSAHRASQRQTAPPVPVIRAFGATETGQKVCAHIHGAFPYLFLKYDGDLNREAVDEYIRDLRISIDHALATSYRRNAYDGKARYVAHITLVKGIPFFGYTVGYAFFLKVYMLNPTNMTRFSDLLGQGAIMNKILQPYEGHLQYLLQWMCDFNLFGCAYINCAKVRFRDPVPDYLELNSLAHKWHDRSISPEAVSDAEQFPRQSHCSLEVDICVEDILNRLDIEARPLHHDFVERFNHLKPDEKFVNSMAGLWKDETKRRKKRMGLTDPSSSPFPGEVLVSMSADPRNLDKGGWIHEEEYRELIDGLVKEERPKQQKSARTFDSFLSRNPLEDGVQSVVKSVEDLFSRNMRRATWSGGLDDNDHDLDIEHPLANGNAPLEGGIVDENGPGFTDDADQANAALATSNDDEIVKALRANGALDALRSSHPVKRANMDETPTQAAKRTKLELANANRAKSQLGSAETEIGLTSSSSQEVSKQRNLNSTFPVVKDPQDPNTVLRLSQGYNCGSQKTPQTPAPKSQITQAVHTPWSHVTDRTTSTMGQSQPKITPAAYDVAKAYSQAYTHLSSLCYGVLPPSTAMIDATMMDYGVPPVIYQDAYYSKEKDVPERAREYAGREFKLQGTTVPFLPLFDPSGLSQACRGEIPRVVVDGKAESLRHSRRGRQCTFRSWEYAKLPPSADDVQTWLQEATRAPVGEPESKSAKKPVFVKPLRVSASQIEGPTQKNKHGFKFSQKQQSTSVQHETQYMSIMSLEVHVNTRGSFVPDPQEDEVACIFWSLKSDGEDVGSDSNTRRGMLVLSTEADLVERIRKSLPSDVELDSEEDELDLINHMVDVVREFDPDILTGYEVHNNSWGFLIERARLKYEFDICDEFSRMKSQSHGRFGKEADRWGFAHTSTIRVTGRHMINVWRAMRGELNLLQYTLENVAFHLLHKRVLHYHYQDLTRWYKGNVPHDLAKTIAYFLDRIQLNLDILETNELVARTSEQARLLGVDFFSVFSRGSQFKVESLMFRIAKPENFVLVSPSRKQVGQQNALECLPLVMEPQSAFYSSPLLVLDFQSLYPSVMIAYNYCYSTCLGRIVGWRGQNKMGFHDFDRAPGLLELVKDHINVAPNGMMYVKPEMRKSLLAKMLTEILETRVMVKSGMKVDKSDRPLQQLLNNRQLALKLIANVTYGYTSASFSGRMPCSEIADSIVQTGRETLEKAIAFIHSVEKWGAEVVYGDTDSLFVYLKGRTRDQAFTIGQEIADAITKRNPRPIKLKFEKVYHPCVLLAKKRYVGFKYESPSQKEPDFDAKGIETVRRDGTPAEQKIEERALKTLFRTADLSEVKRYFKRQCTKIMTGRVSIQDFLFAKEVKLGSYSDKGPPPPGALVATKRMLADPRTEPQYGERIPYIVVTGAPGARLIDRCVDPEALLRDPSLELDAEYYITKNLIPPLERIFNLVGANVRQWYDEMPKVQRIRSVAIPHLDPDHHAGPQQNLKKTLESYMQSSACIVCRAKLPPPTAADTAAASRDPAQLLPLCNTCAQTPARALYTLRRRLGKAERRSRNVELVCRSCATLAFSEEVRCDSRDCPVFYTRVRERAGFRALRESVGVVIKGLEEREAKVGADLQW